MNIRDDAAHLESLLPQVVSVLFHSGEADPLRHSTVGQIRLMRILMSGKKSATELSHALGISPSSLTQMASRMVRAGLVSKELDRTDRRVRILSLTPAGRGLMEVRQRLRARAATRVLQLLEPNKVRGFITLLEEIKDLRVERNMALVEAAV